MLPRPYVQKVAIPAGSFFRAQPRCSSNHRRQKDYFMNGKTTQMAVFFHALVFFLVYSLIAKAMGLVLTKTDLIVTTTLFLLSAQVSSLPSHQGLVAFSGRVKPVSQQLSPTRVFAVVFALLRRQFPQFY